MTSKINIPLSNQKICNALGVAEDDVLLYKELHKFDTVEQLFEKYQFRIILIETKPNSGHWVSLLKDGDTYIFFDSYGYSPDYELNLIPKLQRLLLGEDHREITRLCRGKKIIHNKIRFQGANSSTCGRYNILWIEMWKMNFSLPEFQSFLKRNKGDMSYDELICKLV